MRPAGRTARSSEISPSSATCPSPSSSAIRYPGMGRPIEPGLMSWPGELPTWAVVSVWPYPSRMVVPQPWRTFSITSGLSGSPAESASRTRTLWRVRSSRMSMRHTVGGAHMVVISWVSSTSRVRRGTKRA